MNFWTGLILGIIIGWLVEWIIDWLFWRRDAEEAREADLLLEERMAAGANTEAEWEARLAEADLEYQARLRAVEAEWQDRLNLNEQQWQSRFVELESDNEALRAQQNEGIRGPALGMAMVGAAAAGSYRDEVEEDAELVAAEDDLLVDEMIVAELVEEDVEFRIPDDSIQSDELAIEMPAADTTETADLSSLGEIDSDLAERFQLAGIDSVDTLAEADPDALAVTTGLEREEAEAWVALAAAGNRPATQSDDLTRVRGIGPKFAALLAAAGITTYDDLAEASPDQLRDAINPSPMQQINFGSWSAQAVALANTRGSRVGDDLTTLEGIGPVYASKLRERGITTFADLAAADEATLGDIIAAPAWRRINYGDWIAQARLAAAGDEAGLQALQDGLFRQGGDNLGLIHGMGERSATALHAAGITTFAALAESTPQRLDEIVRDAGVRGGFDYEAWINEAGLRAAGKRVPGTRARTVHVVRCPQDLSAVPGIGPVFEERLYAGGIGSYWSLAELPVEQLETLLDARSLQTDDLRRIQAAAMQLAAETDTLGRAWDGSPPDDFDGLPGIGEIYERRLYGAGICTYAALAAATPEQLAEICKAPSMRTPDYAAWIAIAADLSTAQGNG